MTTMPWLASGLALTVPSVFMLGLASSPHCALMCGPWLLLGMPSLRSQLMLQLGRLSAYALLGLLAGGGAALLLRRFGDPQLAMALRLLAALLLLAMAIYSWRQMRRPACCRGGLHARLQNTPDWARGLLMGLMPCALLYGVIGLAALTASPWSAAALLLAFGLGSSPLLLLAGGLLGRARLGSTRLRLPQTRTWPLALSALWFASSVLMAAPTLAWLCRPGH
ncbi:urease accessory protein UreH domain-containing protein [Hydrocarboniphaga effusa]|nr:sulfite exporter TauE/SafE family protein [Hydrocarboniphaga effusa]